MDNKFIELIEMCSSVISKYLIEGDDYLRYSNMLTYLDKMKLGIINKTLRKDMLYLQLSAMMERDDPDDVIKSIQAVWYYYRDHYQKIID